jgi:hypothetical protein
MGAPTYELIATTTGTSATFTSIPQTYTHLVLAYRGNFSSTNDQFAVRFNNDTAANYSDSSLAGTGTAAGSGYDTNNTAIYCGFVTNTSDNSCELSIFNYTNTNLNKQVLNKFGSTQTQVSIDAGLWRSTSAINRIDCFVYPTSHSFGSSSRFDLYGIKGA